MGGISYLLSCQNDFLSSSGITRVAFMIRATATMSHICNFRMSNLAPISSHISYSPHSITINVWVECFRINTKNRKRTGERRTTTSGFLIIKWSVFLVPEQVKSTEIWCIISTWQVYRWQTLQQHIYNIAFEKHIGNLGPCHLSYKIYQYFWMSCLIWKQ